MVFALAACAAVRPSPSTLEPVWPDLRRLGLVAAVASGGVVYVVSPDSLRGEIRVASGALIGHCARSGNLCVFDTVDDGLIGVDLNGRVIWSFAYFHAMELVVAPSGQSIATRGLNTITGQVGLYTISISTHSIHLVSTTGREPAWSADEGQLAFTEADSVVVEELATQRRSIVATGADRPSLRSRDNEVTYRHVKSDTFMQQMEDVPARRYIPAKDIYTPLRWSPDGNYLLFARKSRRLFAPLSCLEQNEIVIRRFADGADAVIGTTCKGAPINYDWVDNASFLALAKSR